MQKPLYSLVFFDVDSTLVGIEGIEVLSGDNPEVALLTEAAMNGTVPIEQVYARRMDMVRPGRKELEQLGALYVASLVPGAMDVVATLREAGCDLHLVSAGLREAILPLALHLGIAERSVHAVGVEFDERGAYAGFDRRSLLTRTGGKEIVILDIRSRAHGKAALVGDGMSDAEARRAVDLFIGFGGVAIRPRVRELADVYIEECRVSAVLPYLLQEEP